MTETWRLENWDVSGILGRVKYDTDNFAGFATDEERMLIEAGADAMLEALKGLGVYGKLLEGLVKKEDGEYLDIADGHYIQRGWLIFIPDPK